jgi:hypothetical protein
MQVKAKLVLKHPAKGLTILFCLERTAFLNHLTPIGHFSGRTAPLTYRCCIFLFIQQIYVLNILNILHTLRFFLFKMSFISKCYLSWFLC